MKCRFQGTSPFVLDCDCEDCARQIARVAAKSLPEYHELVDAFMKHPIEVGHIHMVPAPGRPCAICGQKIL